MLGEVAWMNSLSNQFYGAWQVQIHPTGKGPYIVPITEAESVIVLKMPENVTCNPQPVTRNTQPDLFDEILTPVRGQQLTLF
jgi:hypothetical protein